MTAYSPDPATVQTVDEGLQVWRQGDVAVADWIGHLVDPARPLTEEAAQGGDEEGSLALASLVVEGLVVVTQTCDVVRSCADRPFVQVAPLIRLEDPIQREAAAGWRPRYAPVPNLGADAFADLDRIVTIEKTILVTCEQVPGWESDAEIRRFSKSVGRKFSRFAFPDDLAEALRPLVKRIREKHKKESEEGRALRLVKEIRIVADPHWAASEIDIFLTFAPDTQEEEAQLPPAKWDELLAKWLELCSPTGVVHEIDGEILSLEELTAREYIESDALDLDHLSFE